MHMQTSIYGLITSKLRYGLIKWKNSTHAHKVFLAQNIECESNLWNKLKLLTLTYMHIEEATIFAKTS